MDTGILNALALMLVICFVAWRICKNALRLSQKGEANGALATSLENMDAATLSTLATKRYKRKRLFRLGVLVCSSLAAAVFLSGQGRFLSIVFLICAALCQYGAIRQNTGSILSQLMQQRSIQPKPSASE